MKKHIFAIVLGNALLFIFFRYSYAQSSSNPITPPTQYSGCTYDASTNPKYVTCSPGSEPAGTKKCPSAYCFYKVDSNGHPIGDYEQVGYSGCAKATDTISYCTPDAAPKNSAPCKAARCVYKNDADGKPFGDPIDSLLFYGCSDIDADNHIFCANDPQSNMAHADKCPGKYCMYDAKDGKPNGKVLQVFYPQDTSKNIGTGQTIPNFSITVKSDKDFVANDSDIVFHISVTYTGNEDITVRTSLPDNTHLVTGKTTGKKFTCDNFSSCTTKSQFVNWKLKENDKPYDFTLTLHPTKKDFILTDDAYGVNQNATELTRSEYITVTVGNQTDSGTTTDCPIPKGTVDCGSYFAPAVPVAGTPSGDRLLSVFNQLGGQCGHCGRGYTAQQNCAGGPNGGNSTYWGIDVSYTDYYDNSNGQKPFYLPTINNHILEWQLVYTKSFSAAGGYQDSDDAGYEGTYSSSDGGTPEKYYLHIHHVEIGSELVNKGKAIHSGDFGGNICPVGGCGENHIMPILFLSKPGGNQLVDTTKYLCVNSNSGATRYDPSRSHSYP